MYIYICIYLYTCEPRSKFIVDVKCVIITLVSPLSFYMVFSFYIFLPLSKHSFEARLPGSPSLPMLVCMHVGHTCGFCQCLSLMWFLLWAPLAGSLASKSFEKKKWFLFILKLIQPARRMSARH